jgi:hypothetical protein
MTDPKNRPKLSPRDAIEIRRRHAEGESIGSLALEYRVLPSSIGPIVHGRVYRPEIVVPVDDGVHLRLMDVAEREGIPLEVLCRRALTGYARRGKTRPSGGAQEPR